MIYYFRIRLLKAFARNIYILFMRRTVCLSWAIDATRNTTHTRALFSHTRVTHHSQFAWSHTFTPPHAQPHAITAHYAMLQLKLSRSFSFNSISYRSSSNQQYNEYVCHYWWINFLYTYIIECCRNCSNDAKKKFFGKRVHEL